MDRVATCAVLLAMALVAAACGSKGGSAQDAVAHEAIEVSPKLDVGGDPGQIVDAARDVNDVAAAADVGETPVCQPCSVDGDCAPGGACYRFGRPPNTDKRCVPLCYAGGACPEFSTCTTSDGLRATPGARFCTPRGWEWGAGACCFGSDCSVLFECEPDRPYLTDNMSCVECLVDAMCPASRPVCKDHACVEGCPPWAPFACAVASGCCECTNDTHCACGACGAEGTCWFHGNGTCACVDPYPLCVVSEGQVTCVECVSDVDCPASCGCVDYACVEPEGGLCPRLSAGCSHDCVTAGCPDPDHLGSVLTCDADAGCCFSPDGRCDDRAAFCTHPGSLCLALRDIFGISAALWLDGAGACNAWAGGFCTCDLTTRDACAAGDPAGLPGCCPAGQACISGDELFQRLAGDSAAEPPLDVYHRGFCVAAPAR